MSDIDRLTANVYEQLGLSRSLDDGSKRNDELGQDDFLKLMLTQLQNQDPFKPMENGDFLGQMAQFGTVSGIGELQATVSSLSTMLQSNKALQASTMVGRRVLVPSQTATLESGGALQGAVDLGRSVASLRIDIETPQGELLHQLTLGSQAAGLVDFSWNGVLADGRIAAPGEYRIRAQASDRESTESFETLAVATVQSVTLGRAGEDLTLSLQGMGETDLATVRRIL